MFLSFFEFINKFIYLGIFFIKKITLLKVV